MCVICALGWPGGLARERVKYSKTTEIIYFPQRISAVLQLEPTDPSYHVSHFVCVHTTMDGINASSTPTLAPTNAAMSPDAAGGDGSSALFLALQNPSLSKAASVLLRSMQETGSISGEDAALMSAFLSSCDIPQPDDFVPENTGVASGVISGRGTSPRVRFPISAGMTRFRQPPQPGPSPHRFQIQNG